MSLLLLYLKRKWYEITSHFISMPQASLHDLRVRKRKKGEKVGKGRREKRWERVKRSIWKTFSTQVIIDEKHEVYFFSSFHRQWQFHWKRFWRGNRTCSSVVLQTYFIPNSSLLVVCTCFICFTSFQSILSNFPSISLPRSLILILFSSIL